MKTYQKYLTVAVISFILGLGAMYYSIHRDTGTSLPSMDFTVPKHDVKGPVKALDKKAIAKVADVPAGVVKDDSKEILATGKTEDISGTSTITAVYDKPSGETTVVETRAFSEWMAGNEFNAGYVMGTLGRGWMGEYRHTFARVWKFYPVVGVTGWMWDSGPRKDDGHLYEGQVAALMSLRW